MEKVQKEYPVLFTFAPLFYQTYKIKMVQGVILINILQMIKSERVKKFLIDNIGYIHLNYIMLSKMLGIDERTLQREITALSTIRKGTTNIPILKKKYAMNGMKKQTYITFYKEVVQYLFFKLEDIKKVTDFTNGVFIQRGVKPTMLEGFEYLEKRETVKISPVYHHFLQQFYSVTNKGTALFKHTFNPEKLTKMDDEVVKLLQALEAGRFLQFYKLDPAFCDFIGEDKIDAINNVIRKVKGNSDKCKKLILTSLENYTLLFDNEYSTKNVRLSLENVTPTTWVYNRPAPYKNGASWFYYCIIPPVKIRTVKTLETMKNKLFVEQGINEDIIWDIYSTHFESDEGTYIQFLYNIKPLILLGTEISKSPIHNIGWFHDKYDFLQGFSDFIKELPFDTIYPAHFNIDGKTLKMYIKHGLEKVNEKESYNKVMNMIDEIIKEIEE